MYVCMYLDFTYKGNNITITIYKYAICLQKNFWTYPLYNGFPTKGKIKNLKDLMIVLDKLMSVAHSFFISPTFLACYILSFKRTFENCRYVIAIYYF